VCGGNSAFLLPNQNEASPATLQFIAKHHRKILFSLGEEKIRRAQNEKSKEYFSVVVRACRAVAGLASLVGGLLKESSNFVQETPPVRKCLCWLALCEGSPADFKRKLEFFIAKDF